MGGELRTLCAGWFQTAMRYPHMAQGICLAVANLNNTLPSWGPSGQGDCVDVFVCLPQNCVRSLAKKIESVEKQMEEQNNLEEWRNVPTLEVYQERLRRNLVLCNWMVYYNFLSPKLHGEIIAFFIGNPGDALLPRPSSVHVITQALMTSGRSLLEFAMVEYAVTKKQGRQARYTEQISGYFQRLLEVLSMPGATIDNGFDAALKEDVTHLVDSVDQWLGGLSLEGPWPSKREEPLNRVQVRLKYNAEIDETELLSCLTEDSWAYIPGNWAKCCYSALKHEISKKLPLSPDNLLLIPDSVLTTEDC